MRRIAFYYSGSKWQLDLFNSEKYRSFFDGIIYAHNFTSFSLSSFDVLLLPRESNQEILLLNRKKIEDFLADGGLIISFGEVVRPWLPNCEWINVNPKFRYEGKSLWEKGELDGKPYKITNPDHPLFNNLDIADLQWHFHGMFKAPVNAEVLLRYGEEGDVIYVDSKSFEGEILAATLDPCVHAGYGVVKKTQKFLDNVLKWAKSGRYCKCTGSTGMCCCSGKCRCTEESKNQK